MSPSLGETGAARHFPTGGVCYIMPGVFMGRACVSVGIDPKVEGGMTADQAKQVMKNICDYSQLLSAEREGAVHIFGCAEGFARLNYEIRVLGTDEIIRWTD